MSGYFKIFRRLFCRHKYEATKFQALIPGISSECVYCKKQIRTETWQ